MVLVIDECQLAFDGDPETVALVTDLVKRGPAAGIIVLLVTQRVDAQSIPTGISSNAVLRWCFKVTGQVENDMILGTSAYKAGIRATMFARTDLGICYFAGEGADPVIAASPTSTAPPPPPWSLAPAPPASPPDCSPATLPASNPSLIPAPNPCWTISPRCGRPPRTGRLSGCGGTSSPAVSPRPHPGLYAGWTGTQVSTAAKPHGLKSMQVKRWVDGRQVNRRGLARTARTAALAAREPDQPEQLDQTAEQWPQLPAPDSRQLNDLDDTDRSDLR